jgi:hypothetical protein
MIWTPMRSVCYIWDYADQNFCVVPSEPFPFHLPIVRDAFA